MELARLLNILRRLRHQIKQLFWRCHVTDMPTVAAVLACLQPRRHRQKLR